MAIGSLVGIVSHGLFAPAGGSCDYPADTDVRDGVVYADGLLTGNVVLPAEADVVVGVEYGANGTEYEGTFTCTVPPSPDVAGDQPFAAILNLLVSRVALALGTTTTWVRPVASDSYTVTSTENVFAYIRCFGPSPVDPTTGMSYANDGAGRWRTVVGRRIRIYIYTRSGVDSYGGDEIALMGADPGQVPTTPPTAPGQFAMEESVLNALQNWVITYTVGSTIYPLTIGPFHWLDSESGPPERAPENEAGLVRSHLDFQVLYTLDCQRTEPAPTGLPVPVIN